MLQQNIDYLQQRNPTLLRLVEQKNQAESVQVVNSKVGIPTLQVQTDEHMVYVHSAYDPLKEAERLVEQKKEEIAKHEHIFFYGVGLGYHIEKVIELFPNKTYTLYEPSLDVFKCYMSLRPLPRPANLRYIFVETDEQARQQFFKQFSLKITTDMMLFVLPSYERIYREALLIVCGTVCTNCSSVRNVFTRGSIFRQEMGFK